jgi:glycosyltransferase involved in cell wall biosynthesis
MEKADLVVVSADKLFQSKRHVNPRTVLIRHGVDFDHFRQALDPQLEVPPDLASLQRPVIGYFGLMSGDWFDLELMVEVASHFKQCSFVLLGKVTMDLSALTALKNVHVLGRKPYASLPAYAKGFDVAIIPFPINDLTLSANPLKAREYLAAGLPVVSTAIPEVEVLGTCRMARDPGEFIEQIEAALHDPGPKPERSESIRHESWSSRLEELRRHVVRLA